jgi:hypothetical protein
VREKLLSWFILPFLAGPFRQAAPARDHPRFAPRNVIPFRADREQSSSEHPPRDQRYVLGFVV